MMIKSIHIGIIQKGSFCPGLAITPLNPLKPKNHPKYCNSVTILKNGDFRKSYWLQFWLQFLIEIKKNCNQLGPSSGYSFKTSSYDFFKNPIVTVTILIYSVLNKINTWLQNYNFLVLTPEDHFV